VTTEWTSLDLDSTKAWSELTTVLAEFDGTDEIYGPEELAEELSDSGFDPARDTVAVWEAAELIAFGQLRIPAGLNEGRVRAFIGGGVHPDRRRQGIGAGVMERMERRAFERSAEMHPGVDVKLESAGGIEGSPVRELLEHRGYKIVRYFVEMKRKLPGPVLDQPAVELRSYASELSEAVRIAHNDAFATHWGSTGRAPAEWADQLRSRTFRPRASFVHLDEDRSVDAYVLGYQWLDGELYIGQIGTVQAARGRGLARACLLACLHAATQQGYRTVDLTVDSYNATGAVALYESVGFTPARTVASYTKLVSPLGRSVPGDDPGRSG